MVGHVHDLPEHRDPDQDNGRRPILYEDILKAVGRAADAKEVADELQRANFLRSKIGEC
jgi:hypothetical protein